MKQVVNAYRRKNLDKQRLAVLRLELNYELAVLYEALQEENEDKKSQAKRKLNKIREELIKLKAL
ncbi:hypothetical protein MUB24_20830 [Lederbergia sp. NSJ-179]|uniref:hypothetical protein n=1 Tax=Lederbergia sp. NSJ-179 TaxID=2931402 RepID=UPI001FD0344B|nr:hypothetical protein [Lederbergia sp. NSJ-179]MCJ7843275.1 hypothetical protein [Lederbergia sp. NSJ-179]